MNASGRAPLLGLVGLLHATNRCRRSNFINPKVKIKQFPSDAAIAARISGVTRTARMPLELPGIFGHAGTYWRIGLTRLKYLDFIWSMPSPSLPIGAQGYLLMVSDSSAPKNHGVEWNRPDAEQGE